jgi:hypothetical protein
MSDLQKLLSSLREYVHRPDVRRALESRYDSPTAASARVEEHISRIVGALGSTNAPSQDLEREANDQLVGFLLADAVPLPVKTLKGRRAIEGINTRKAMCLWLGSRQHQSVGLSGLWHAWESLLPDQLELPESIRAIVDPPAVEGAEQAYLDAAHVVLMAFVVTSAGRAAPPAMGVPEAHRRFARTLLGVACDRVPPIEEPERTLCSLLARTFGVSDSRDPRELIGGIRQAAAEASLRYQFMPDDTTTMLTWIVGTCVPRRDGTLAAPEVVLEDHMRNKTKRNHVHVDLLRGRNTLRDRIVRRLLETTQNRGADDAGT